MAGSNWDKMLWDADGRPIESPSDGADYLSTEGVGLQLMKHWLYILDETRWREGPCRFARPIMCRLLHGELEYGDLTVLVRRVPWALLVETAPGDGCFVYAWESKTMRVVLAGVGVGGFDLQGSWKGVRGAVRELLAEEIDKLDGIGPALRSAVRAYARDGSP